MKRGAKESDLQVGDRVVLIQTKRFKSDPRFGTEKFTIMARDGAKIVVRSDQGVMYSRNIGDAKKVFDSFENIPTTTDEHSSEEMDDDAENEDFLKNKTSDVRCSKYIYFSYEIMKAKLGFALFFFAGKSDDSGAECVQQALAQNTKPRSKRETKLPSKFKDMLLYNVYE